MNKGVLKWEYTSNKEDLGEVGTESSIEANSMIGNNYGRPRDHVACKRLCFKGVT